MDQKLLPRMSKLPIYISFFLHAIVIIAVGFLIYTNLTGNSVNRVSKREILVHKNSETEKSAGASAQPIAIEMGESCPEFCKQEIVSEVAKAVATISASPSTAVVNQSVTQTSSPQVSFVPLGSSYSTTSQDWMTIEDSAVFINLINEYGEDAKVSWEASLKVAHGNGQAFARLWDDTNKIAVVGSEIATTNNLTYSTVSSKDLAFWRGGNIYKVQLKSLNGFEVYYSGGKIKIRH